MPVSVEFDDVYFSRAGGLAETRAIFLQQNGLPERWRAPNESTGQLFTIGELGFGTGLNFCATVRAFRETAEPCRRLRYYSCESRPLSRDDLAQSLKPYAGELADEVEELLAIYPPAISGAHVLPLNGRIQLVLLFGEALESFAALRSARDFLNPASSPGAPEQNSPGVNAWYLDGFAPARNPAMWSAGLFAELARLSAPDASFATYTAAGAVRRALQSAGFRVQKIPGFAGKREMLRGQILRRDVAAGEVAADETDSGNDRPPEGSPHHARSSATSQANEKGNPAVQPVKTRESREGRPEAIVIGAGLAGMAATRALVQRGYRVSVIERESRVAAGASGNALGVAAPAPTAQPTPLSRLTRAGLYHLRAVLNELRTAGSVQAPKSYGAGALLLAHTPALERRFAAFMESAAGAADRSQPFARALSTSEGAEISGAALAHPSLFFPDAFCISAPRLCEAQLNAAVADGTRFGAGEANPRLILHTEAIALEREAGGWRVLDAQDALLARAPTVVLANAADLSRLEQAAGLPLQRVRGQSCALPSGDATPGLKTALCYDGYITPASPESASEAKSGSLESDSHAGGTGESAPPEFYQVGATFESWSENPGVEPEQNRHLLERLRAVAPGFENANTQPPETLGARVAFRTASSDRLPLIGPLPDARRWAAADPALAGETEFRADQPGLFVFSALGSRGLVYAGIGAEILAAWIAGETAPLEAELIDSVRPDRFLRRTARRSMRARPARPRKNSAASEASGSE